MCVAAWYTGDIKPETGYLKAGMGGACMPNGDTDQRLISLGAHFNLTTHNTHTRAHGCGRKHTHTQNLNIFERLTCMHRQLRVET